MGVEFGFDLDEFVILGMVGGVLVRREFVRLLGSKKFVGFHPSVSL